MILVSAALVLAAIVLLIAGVVLAKPFLVMWSIVISVLSAVSLLIGALLRRHELFPAGGRPAVPEMAPAGVPALSGAPAHQMPMPLPAFPQQAFPRQQGLGGLGGEDIVLVIPGRKRFHLANCRQLVGREVEELTTEEAREEGFTPCTTCLPDAFPRTTAEIAESQETAAPQETTASQKTAAPGRAGSEVTVLVGTRRFHDPKCPLISGADVADVETMAKAEAEEAGLTHCSVCQEKSAG